ncbi:HmuY family protein [Pedobacter xixiisoli]|uniref:HmuY family protein n=1 Tax=Pedobacter xixiisoli TaxID=1476464 RepID=UPI001486FDEE|nr:HmuY family protein [Pedobacter xixiisoli]
MTFVSLENSKVITAEPEKANWDISWSYTTYNSGLGSPYWVQDFISLNTLTGVSAVQVSTSVKSYAAFAEGDLTGLNFSAAKDVIGTKWRTAPNTSGVGGGVKTDLFYVIKDGSGNVYKLKFNSYISGDGGERGKPVIEYKLIKKG